MFEGLYLQQEPLDYLIYDSSIDINQKGYACPNTNR